MNSHDSGVLFRRLRYAPVGVLAVCFLGIASAANAAGPSDPDGEPPPSASKPNLLFTAASVELLGTSQWEIRYTVANRGTTSTPAFHVSVKQDPSTPIKDTSHSSLAPGASRSEVVHIGITSCYIAVRFTADSTHVVRRTSTPATRLRSVRPKGASISTARSVGRPRSAWA